MDKIHGSGLLFMPPITIRQPPQRLRLPRRIIPRGAGRPAIREALFWQTIRFPLGRKCNRAEFLFSPRREALAASRILRSKRRIPQRGLARLPWRLKRCINEKPWIGAGVPPSRLRPFPQAGLPGRNPLILGKCLLRFPKEYPPETGRPRRKGLIRPSETAGQPARPDIMNRRSRQWSLRRRWGRPGSHPKRHPELHGSPPPPRKSPYPAYRPIRMNSKV